MQDLMSRQELRMILSHGYFGRSGCTAGTDRRVPLHAKHSHRRATAPTAGVKSALILDATKLSLQHCSVGNMVIRCRVQVSNLSGSMKGKNNLLLRKC